MDISFLATFADRPALEIGDLTLSYHDLGRRVAAIRAALTDVEPGPIAGYYDHTPDGVAAFLAVLGSGCWYVPLAPVQGAARVAAILADCRPRLVLTDREDLDHPHIRTDLLAPAAEPPRATAHRLAYGIYTSGSTGTPKGVLIGQSALAASTRARTAIYGPGGTLFLAAPFCFDSSISMFGPLTTGGTVRLASPSARHDAIKLASQAARASHLLVLPSLYAQLLDVWGTRQPAWLKVAIVAGETLTPGVVRRHFTLAPSRRLVNEYGPTEATVFCTAHDCTPEDGAADVVPIGTAIPGYRVDTIDGEICVSGPGLFDGYLNQPALTAQKLHDVGGSRWYRTGDRARRRDDGALLFQGRLDDQVKVRGVRVELAEADRVLAGVPQVLEAASALIDGRLTGFVRGAAGSDAVIKALRAAGTADYLIPQAVHVVQALPRTATGKLDRAALAGLVPASASFGPSPASSPTACALDALIAACREVTGTAVDAAGSFLDHGDSLAAMRVGVRLHLAGWALDPVSLLGSGPLARAAERMRPVPAAAPAVGHIATASGAALGSDLSPVQSGVWFAQSMAPTSNAFVVPMRIRFARRVDAGRLAGALDAVVRRHPVLGCRIGRSGRRTVMIPGEPPRLEVKDVSGFVADADPFDLREHPPLRATLAGDDLHLTVHHLVFDGWSKAVLLRDLAEAYTGGAVRPVPPDFAAFAAAARAADERGEHQADAALIAERLKGVPSTLSLRADDSATPSLRLAGTIADVDASVTAALARLAARRRVTLFTVLLAGFGEALSQLHPGPFIVGTVWANRPTAAAEETVGLFTNVVPVALDPPAHHSFLTHTRDRVQEALRGAHVPFHRVVQAAAPPRDARFAPLVQVLFEYTGQALPRLSFAGIPATIGDDGLQQGAVCDFSMRVFPRRDGLRCVAVHDASVIDGIVAGRLLDLTRQAWLRLANLGE